MPRPISLRENLRFSPGMRETMFGDMSSSFPSRERPRFTYSPFTSRIRTGAPSSTRVVTRSLLRCDFPVPFRPVITFSRPSRLVTSLLIIEDRLAEPNSNKCPVVDTCVSLVGDRTSTLEWILDGSHEVSREYRVPCIAPRIFPTSNRVSFRASSWEDTLNGSMSVPVSEVSEMPSLSRSSSIPGMFAY